MTEKRFVDYFDKDHNYIIQDLQNEDEYQVGFVNCDEDVFLELINQLSDENEQLKSKINKVDDKLYSKECDVFDLKKENEQLKKSYDLSEDYNDSLSKENEELHQIQMELVTERDSLRKENSNLFDENGQLQQIINQLRTDNTKQKKLLNETMKQNKHTTTTIQTMMDTERTELGKSVLKQLWEAIQ